MQYSGIKEKISIILIYSSAWPFMILSRCHRQKVLPTALYKTVQKLIYNRANISVEPGDTGAGVTTGEGPVCVRIFAPYPAEMELWVMCALFLLRNPA